MRGCSVIPVSITLAKRGRAAIVQLPQDEIGAFDLVVTELLSTRGKRLAHDYRLRFSVLPISGAVPREILGLVLSQGVRLAVVGITVGLLGALVASRLLTRLLFQTEPTDIATFVSTTAALALVAVAASLVPALHAVRTDPVDALRSE